MADKITLARLKKFGKNFEISVNPDLALQFKKGELEEIRDVLLAENVYSDAKKGLVISPTELQEIFQTSDPTEVAKLIVKEGEIQLTAEHRAQERGQKKRKLIEMIHKQAIDPNTNLPHPANRIEAAMDEARITVDEHKTAEEQFDDVIVKLRPIIPIKIEQKIMILEIPSVSAGKCYQFVKNNSKVLKEEWKSDGNWRIKIELPAGFQQEMIDKLNSITRGELIVENE